MDEGLEHEVRNKRVGWILAKRTLSAAVSCAFPAEHSSGAGTDSVESDLKERHLDGGLALRVNISVEPHLCPGLLHGHSVLCDSHHDADSF